jgi:hypothetical protein
MEGHRHLHHRNIVIGFETSAQQSGARQDAIVAQEAAAAAREAATMAREQAREQAQAMRDRAQVMRDMARLQRESFPPVITIPTNHGPTPRQEKMLFGGFVIAVLAAVVIFYPIMRALARRLEGAGRKATLDTGSAERLQRIEQALDAMAIEIERISEGQRFTTRLLMNRAESSEPVRR